MAEPSSYNGEFAPESGPLSYSVREPTPPPEKKPDEVTPRRVRHREPENTRSQFKGTSVPIQLKLDSELIESLKLIAVSSKRSMSEIVMECLTTNEKISKTWTMSRRDAA